MNTETNTKNKKKRGKEKEEERVIPEDKSHELLEQHNLSLHVRALLRVTILQLLLPQLLPKKYLLKNNIKNVLKYF